MHCSFVVVHERRAIQEITRVTPHQVNLLSESIHVNFIEGRGLVEEHTETLPDIIIILFDLNIREPCKNIQPWLVECKRINKDAHITLIGTHLENPEARILDTETIDELCIKQEVSLSYYEVGSAEIVTRYQNIILTNIASLVSIQKLNKLKGTEKAKYLDMVYRWSFSNNSFELTSTLYDNDFHPTKLVVGQFAKQAGMSLFNKFPAIQYCMVTNKLAINPDEYSMQPMYANTTNNRYSSTWEPQDMEQPLKTEGCRAQYIPRLMIDWSNKKLRCLHPSWFSFKTDLFNYHKLSVVKLRNNKLHFIPREIYTTPDLIYLDISHNRLSFLPGFWILGSKIQILLANDNNILTIDLENYGFEEENFETQNTKELKVAKSAISPSNSQDLFGLFGEDFFKKSKCQIWMLQLQNNNLKEIQVTLLDCLKLLEYLDISNNPIKVFNGHLNNTLKFLNVDNLPLISPPRYIADLGLTNIRTYLTQLNLSDSNNIWNRHRIVVIGLSKSGKTSLIHKLLEKPIQQKSERMTQGLKIYEWKTRSKTLQFWKRLDSLFDIWDFSGDSIFQPLYNMFRPSSSLHVIVCNMVELLKDIKFQNSLREPLRVLLMSIQAVSWKKDRSLTCVLVFTHLDEILKDERDTKKVVIINSISQYIKDMNLVLINDMTNSVYSSPSSKLGKVNPDGVNLVPSVIDVQFVSSLTGEGMPKLTARLTQDICIRLEQAAYAKSVPLLYLEFEKRIREVRENVRTRIKKKSCSIQPFEKFFTQPLVCSDDIYHSLRGTGFLRSEIGHDLSKEAVSDMITFFHEV
ncbi:hypothetical protein LOD99_3539 [Oopsacas minuta]|uniref:Roc domain-containing protein n=1 Tax=Oopsacas minuta TaxID=111878 RepID=A0AAV7JYS7_9METZ|nr:hypothetical protein LOD99_3539 [Oopsacas minuta]